MAWFRCSVGGGGGGETDVNLIVTCSPGFAGSTISCTNGSKTYTQTCPSSSPYTVTFENIEKGTWTISGVVSGQTFTQSVTIGDYTAELNSIPDGATVTPVNDIQIWLHCANIWDKTYTTISQVLSDTSTLLALISSNNAADYMARSTNWASSVCANSTAMGYIGNNNYCANKLLANSTWATAICNSTYFESVLNKKVPTMTSNTTPSGVASSRDYYTGQPYLAFDGDNSTLTNSQNDYSAASGWWLRYQFTDAVKAIKVRILFRESAHASRIALGHIRASADGTNFINIDGGTLQNLAVDNNIVLAGNTAYKYWEIYVDTATDRIAICTLQFYGR